MSTTPTDKVIKLRGKTQHGKNRVREQGEFWRVHEHNYPALKNKLYLVSEKTGDWRILDEKDFEIVV